MRTTFYQILILAWCSTFVLAYDGNGQEVLNRQISVTIENQRVEQAIKQIGRLASVRFIYSPQLIRADRKVNLSVQGQPLSSVLNSLLAPLDLTYEVVGSQIILRNAPAQPAPRANDHKEAMAVPAPADRTLTGTVYDDQNVALPGVSVSIKGTTRGTTTDAGGKYTLTLPDQGAVLLFSFVGYVTKEVTVGNQTQLNVTLSADTKNLSEVVVVGYGTQKKATLTGSVATIDSKTFNDRGPIASPLAALQGQAPGVTVTRTSSQPGREGWNFQIRGATSVNGTEPLVIVDGIAVPNQGALNSFNPSDIDNISFLKDAAAAIYGARAAGGVVLITTKRAKNGKATVEYSGSVSQKIVGLKPDLVDVNGWGPLIREARLNDGFGRSDVWLTLADMSIYAKQNGKNYLTRSEWQALIAPGGQFAGGGIFGEIRDYMFFDGTIYDQMWGTATTNQHQLTVSGRTEKAGYRISLGYLNDGSILQVGNNSNKRYNLRLGHDYQISPKLFVQSNISLEKNDIIQPTGIGTALNNGIQPGQPLHTIDGKAYGWGGPGVSLNNINPYSIAELGGDNKEFNTRINTNFNLTYTITKDLKAIASTGYYFHNTDYNTTENLIDWYDYSGKELLQQLTASGTSRGFFQRSARKESYYNVTGYLEYNKTLGEDHEIKAIAGAQYERDEVNRFSARTLDPVPGVPPTLSNNTSVDASSKTIAETANHYALAGYFSRLNYSFRNKYLLEANARYDGSSKFTADSRWKLFYGVLGAWRLGQEEFLKPVTFISDLKLRASYGTVGNQSGIGLYDYITQLNLNYSTGQTSSGFPIIGTAPVIRVSPGGIVAFDRTWETIATTDFGLDYAFLRNRLSGTFDYFIKENKNMLIARTYPGVLGASAPAGNNGELRTWGWELSLNWRDRIGKFNYHIGGNISDNQNKLVGFGGQTIISNSNRGYNTAVEGFPIGTYFGLDYAGRIQTTEQLDAYKKLFYATGTNINTGFNQTSTSPQSQLQLGDNMFRDVNGDGKLTFPEDAVAIGRDDPRYSYSFNGGFEWNGFDFNFIFQGVGQRTIIRDGNWRIPAAVLFQSQNAAFLNQWWTSERTDAFLPRLSSTGTINNYNYYPSNWVAENGAYLRLKNLVIGYTIPQRITQKARIQRLRVYFSGNDLWETTKIRDGWDPESTRTVSNNGDSNNNNVSTFSQRYPFYRFLTYGVNLTF